jgi:hypothetical protein
LFSGNKNEDSEKPIGSSGPWKVVAVCHVVSLVSIYPILAYERIFESNLIKGVNKIKKNSAKMTAPTSQYITTASETKETLVKCMKDEIGDFYSFVRPMVVDVANESIEKSRQNGYFENFTDPELFAQSAYVTELERRRYSDTKNNDKKEIRACQWMIGHDRSVKTVAMALRKCSKPTTNSI